MYREKSLLLLGDSWVFNRHCAPGKGMQDTTLKTEGPGTVAGDTKKHSVSG